MNIIAIEDTDQTDSSDRERMPICPNCKQKLFEVVSLRNRLLIRHRCRRCGIYVKITVIGEKD